MTLEIPANDHGRIYVFSVSGSPPAGLKDKTDAALTAAFGTLMNEDFVDVVDVAALHPMTLSAYVQQGYDIAPEGPDKAALQDARGHVVLVLSRAFGGEETTVTPAQGITHIATLTDPLQPRPHIPLDSAAAKGVLTPPKGGKVPSDAAMSGRIATIALLVLFLLVALMIWIAA